MAWVLRRLANRSLTQLSYAWTSFSSIVWKPSESETQVSLELSEDVEELELDSELYVSSELEELSDEESKSERRSSSPCSPESSS